MKETINSFYNSVINVLLLTTLLIVISTISFFIKSREHSFSITINEKQVVAERRINELEEDNVKLLDLVKTLEQEIEQEKKKERDNQKQQLELQKLVEKNKVLEQQIVKIQSDKGVSKMDCNVAWYLKNKYGTYNKFFEPYLKKNAPKEVYNAIFNCK